MWTILDLRVPLINENRNGDIVDLVALIGLYQFGKPLMNCVSSWPALGTEILFVFRPIRESELMIARRHVFDNVILLTTST